MKRLGWHGKDIMITLYRQLSVAHVFYSHPVCSITAQNWQLNPQFKWKVSVTCFWFLMINTSGTMYTRLKM